MDKKTLSGKTVLQLKEIHQNLLKQPVPKGTLKDNLVQIIIKAYKKEQKSGTKLQKISDKPLQKLPEQKQTPQKSPEKKQTPQKLNKLESKGRYNLITQLGSKGKEGTTFHVKNKRGDEFAMKTFAKSKSSNTLQKEAYYQSQAAKHGIAPKIKEINETEKFIVMDKLDRNLFDIIKKNNGEIPEHFQKEIINVISKMDQTGVFHGDPNPANFMIKGNNMYMIDYGFARDIDDKLIRKYKTETPNQKFMILGLILKLKEIYRDHNPNIEYKVLSKMLPA